MLFKEFNLCEEVLDGIRDMGFDEATEIQQKAIPIALDGKNLLGTSFTGSGKTAAFVLPIIHQIFKSEKKGIQALVLAPTRELAQQIDEQFWSLGYHAGISSVCVYGGSNWSDQEKALKAGVNVVVATPGRLLDQMKITTYDFSNISHLILDEADRMLDMGFLPDVRNIINRIPEKRQTLLFSATSNARIETIAKEFTGGSFERVKVGRIAPAQGINQMYFKVGDSDKKDLLLHLYKLQEWHSAIVFSSTKRGVRILARSLGKMGVAVDSIHGDRDQKEREYTLDRFRSGKIKVLVATDVMSRGIDVDDISHIINYDVPNDVDDYIHRIGRTARAKSTGTAITFVSRRDWRSMLEIIDSKGLEIKEEQVPEEITSKSKGDDSDERSGRGRGNSRGRVSGSGGKNDGRGGRSDQRDSRGRSQKPKQENDKQPNTKEGNSADEVNKADQGETGTPVKENKGGGKSDNDKKDNDSASKNRSSRPKQKPRRTSRSKKNVDNTNNNDSGDKQPAGDETSEKSAKKEGPRKSHSRTRPKRRPGNKGRNTKDNQSKSAKDDSSPNEGEKSSGRRSSGGRKSSGRGNKDTRDSGKKGKPVTDKQKYIQKQEKLIEQVQQSTIPSAGKPEKKSKSKTASKGDKGIWGKLKNLFD